MSLVNKVSNPPVSGSGDNIKAVFFDMGSTLACLRPGWQGIYHQVFQTAGLDLSLDEVEAAVSRSWEIVAAQDHEAEYLTSLEGNRAWQREIEERVMEQLHIQPEIREEIFWQIIAAFEDPASYELYPDALPVLDRLKRSGYRLAIISNWSWHLPELCDALGLTPYFEHIFTSARVGFPKPRRQIFETALATLDLPAEQTLHIGDSWQADIQGAMAAGIPALWLVRPEEKPLYREGRPPAETEINRIAGLDEIPAFLKIAG